MKNRDLISECLAQIEADHGGRLTPEAVVAHARAPNSPLHDQFEWDVKKASYRYWIQQARTLITSVMVVQKTEKTTVSAVYYVRDPSAEPSDQGYVSIEKLKSDVDMAREAIVEEFSRAAAMLRRAKNLAAILKIEEDVDELIEHVHRVHKTAESVVTM